MRPFLKIKNKRATDVDQCKGSVFNVHYEQSGNINYITLFPTFKTFTFHLPFSKAAWSKRTFVHISLSYKAILPLINRTGSKWECSSFERSSFMQKFLKQSGYQTDEFGNQIHKFLLEIQFISNSSQLSSTLDFQLRARPCRIRLRALPRLLPSHLCKHLQGLRGATQGIQCVSNSPELGSTLNF